MIWMSDSFPESVKPQPPASLLWSQPQGQIQMASSFLLSPRLANRQTSPQEVRIPTPSELGSTSDKQTSIRVETHQTIRSITSHLVTVSQALLLLGQSAHLQAEQEQVPPEQLEQDWAQLGWQAGLRWDGWARRFVDGLKEIEVWREMRTGRGRDEAAKAIENWGKRAKGRGGRWELEPYRQDVGRKSKRYISMHSYQLRDRVPTLFHGSIMEPDEKEIKTTHEHPSFLSSSFLALGHPSHLQLEQEHSPPPHLEQDWPHLNRGDGWCGSKENDARKRGREDG